MKNPHEVTALLADFRSGNETVLDRLVPLVYGELRRIAQAQIGRAHV